MVMSDVYAAKTASYFRGVRRDIVDALPERGGLVALEVGCAEGRTGEYALATGKCRHFVGVDIAEAAAREARKRLSAVIVGDIETMDLPFEDEFFDVLILSEVLEHLIDPWQALARLTVKLKPGGRVYASSPNVSQRAVVMSLIRGRWELAERGVMDRTHLRWFTPASYQEMFEEAGFQTISIGPLVPPTFRVRAFNAMTGNMVSHLFVRQINYAGARRR